MSLAPPPALPTAPFPLPPPLPRALATQVVYCPCELLDSAMRGAQGAGARLQRVMPRLQRFMGSSGMGSPAQSLRVMARPSFWARLKDEVLAPMEAAADAIWRMEQGLDEAGQPAPDMQPTAEIYNDVASAGTYCYPGCTTLRCATEAELHQSRLRKNKCAKCRMVCYCDTKCQKADWPRHKQACKHLRKA